MDPTTGREQAKTRPVVIVSLDAFNARLDTVVVCSLTSRLHPTWRTRLAVRVGDRPAAIVAPTSEEMMAACHASRAILLHAPQTRISQSIDTL